MNVFVVNTPFQLFVVRHIILQYFCQIENLIISTIKEKKADDVYTIPHGVKGILKGRILLSTIKRNIEEISFFIPHMGNFFSSYFFELSQRYHRPISVFYEGVALFYDPIIQNDKAKRKRTIEALLLGFRYRHYSKLYPEQFIEAVDCCYSPIETPLLNKFKKTNLIKFDKNNILENNNILLLTSDVALNEEISNCVKDISSYINDDRQKVYIKPHYSLAENIIYKFMETIQKETGHDAILLDKNSPIEDLYDKIQTHYVICQRFTSAIINMKFILGDNVVCKVTNKESVPYDILNKLGISVE